MPVCIKRKKNRFKYAYSKKKRKKKNIKWSKKTRTRRNHYNFSQFRLDNKCKVNFANINDTLTTH